MRKRWFLILLLPAALLLMGQVSSQYKASQVIFGDTDTLQEKEDAGSFASSISNADCSGVSPCVVGQLCQETADDSLWRCTTAPSTWTQVASAAGGTVTNPLDGDLSIGTSSFISPNVKVGDTGPSYGSEDAILFDLPVEIGPPFVCTGDGTTACTAPTGAADCSGVGGPCIRDLTPLFGDLVMEVTAGAGANNNSWYATDIVTGMRYNETLGGSDHYAFQTWEWNFFEPTNLYKYIERIWGAQPNDGIGCPGTGGACRFETFVGIPDHPDGPQAFFEYNAFFDDKLERTWNTQISNQGLKSGLVGNATLGRLEGWATGPYPVVGQPPPNGGYFAAIPTGEATGLRTGVSAVASHIASNHRGTCDGAEIGTVCEEDADCAGDCVKTGGICLETSGGADTDELCATVQDPPVTGGCTLGTLPLCESVQRWAVMRPGELVGMYGSARLEESSLGSSAIPNFRRVGWCSDDEGKLCTNDTICTAGTCTFSEVGKVAENLIGSRSEILVDVTDFDPAGDSNLSPSTIGNTWGTTDGRQISNIVGHQIRFDLDGLDNTSSENLKVQLVRAMDFEAPQMPTTYQMGNVSGLAFQDWGNICTGATNSTGCQLIDFSAQTNSLSANTAGHGSLFTFRGNLAWDDLHFKLGGNTPTQTGDHIFWDDTNEVLRVKIDAAGEGVGRFGPASETDGSQFLTGSLETGDPCGTRPEGFTFYNDTSDHYCFCDGAGTPLQTSSPLTGCFVYEGSSGSTVVDPGSINSATCATAITETETGVATTDVVSWTFDADPTAVTGYAPVTSGAVYIVAYPTTDTINFKVCNPTTSSIDPGSVTLNWMIDR